MSRSLLVSLAAMLLLGVVDSAAQTGDGSLRGFVKDEQGAVLPGVTVTTTSPALIRPVTAVTDASGYYRLLNEDINELPGFVVGKIKSVTYDGVTNDLLTAGLGKSGLAGAAPPVADPLNPTDCDTGSDQGTFLHAAELEVFSQNVTG